MTSFLEAQENDWASSIIFTLQVISTLINLTMIQNMKRRFELISSWRGCCHNCLVGASSKALKRLASQKQAWWWEDLKDHRRKSLFMESESLRNSGQGKVTKVKGLCKAASGSWDSGFLLLFLFFETGSCWGVQAVSKNKNKSSCVAQIGLRFEAILLPQPTECWD